MFNNLETESGTFFLHDTMNKWRLALYNFYRFYFHSPIKVEVAGKSQISVKLCLEERIKPHNEKGQSLLVLSYHCCQEQPGQILCLMSQKPWRKLPKTDRLFCLSLEPARCMNRFFHQSARLNFELFYRVRTSTVPPPPGCTGSHGANIASRPRRMMILHSSMPVVGNIVHSWDVCFFLRVINSIYLHC